MQRAFASRAGTVLRVSAVAACHPREVRALVTLAAAWFAATPAHAETVFLSPAEAHALISEGADVLDARDASPPFLPGAQRIDWMALRDGRGRTGRLAPDDDLRVQLTALGLSVERSILVYGKANAGFGEEGRIWWMLRYLGYPRVFILDGGYAAWKRSGRPVSTKLVAREGRAPLVGARRPDLRVDTEEVRRASTSSRGAHILDVRGPEEFAGQTPFGSPRGGHVPRAQNLPWTRLFGADGTLRPKHELERIVAAAGARPGVPIITYCTGGVRSALVQAVLHHLGHTSVANYDGSWWAWSLDDDTDVAR